MGSLLPGRYRLSVRETAGVFDDLLSVPVGIGSVSGLCREVSAAVAEPYEAVQEAVRKQGSVNVAANCRQQQRNLLGYLTDAVVAHRLGQSAPVLLTGRYVSCRALNS